MLHFLALNNFLSLGRRVVLCRIACPPPPLAVVWMSWPSSFIVLHWLSNSHRLIPSKLIPQSSQSKVVVIFFNCLQFVWSILDFIGFWIVLNGEMVFKSNSWIDFTFWIIYGLILGFVMFYMYVQKAIYLSLLKIVLMWFYKLINLLLVSKDVNVYRNHWLIRKIKIRGTVKKKKYSKSGAVILKKIKVNRLQWFARQFLWTR